MSSKFGVTKLYFIPVCPMSRYVCHFLVNLSSQNVRSPLKKLLETCRMETIYEVEDYLMAREIPGRVAFAKLVRVEVLIDVSTTNPDTVKLSFVVKNEELPLNANNHCRQTFDLLRMTIASNYSWQPVNSLQSVATAESSQLDSHRFLRVESLPTTGSTTSSMMN
jgi:hypothetical protein